MSTPFDPNNPQNPHQGPPQHPYQGPYGQQPPNPYPGQQQPQWGQPQPPPGQFQPPTMTAPPPPPVKRPWYKKKRFIIPLLFLVFIILIAQCGGDTPSGTALPADPSATAAATQGPASKAPAASKEPEATKEPEPTKEPEAKLPGIGDKAVAGDWEFKVTKFKCGAKKVGENEYLEKKAQGQFCIMSLSVTNNSDTAEYLTDSNQKILDKDGKTYSSDSEASIYADSSNSLLSEEINPGNTVKGIIVFDVPKKVKPTEASLAGGAFGIMDVVKVDLT